MSKSAKKNGKQAQSDVLYDIAIDALSKWSPEKTAGALQALRMVSPDKAAAFENLLWAASFEKPALMVQHPTHA